MSLLSEGVNMQEKQFSASKTDVDREYGLNQIQSSPQRKNYKSHYELEYSKIVEVSETNESDGNSRIFDKENRM